MSRLNATSRADEVIANWEEGFGKLESAARLVLLESVANCIEHAVCYENRRVVGKLQKLIEEAAE